MGTERPAGHTDRTQINVSDRIEADFWTEKLGVTRVKLKAAINAVGPSAKAVEAYLKKK